MSKADRKKKRQKHDKPSAPGSWRRPVEANDNHANDNHERVKVGGVWLNENQALRYRTAQEGIASGVLDRRREGERTLRQIEQEVAERVADKAVQRGLRERMELEALRGQAVGSSRIEGAVGVAHIARDGLEHLFARKSISKVQHDAGQRFRLDYEKMNPERALAPPQLDPAKVTIPHGGDNWESKKAEAIDRIICIYRMICGIDSKPGDKGMLPLLSREHSAMRSIAALNMIAGQGFVIAELTSSSRARARMKEDLVFALDACAIVHDLEPEDDQNTTS